MWTTRSSRYGSRQACTSCSARKRGRWRCHRRRVLDGRGRNRRRQRPRRVARVLRKGDDDASTRVVPPRRDSGSEQVGLNVSCQVRPSSGLELALEIGQGLRLGGHVGHGVRCIVGRRGCWQAVTGHPAVAGAMVSPTSEQLLRRPQQRRTRVTAARAPGVGRRRRCKRCNAHDGHAPRLCGRRRYSRRARPADAMPRNDR